MICNLFCREIRISVANCIDFCLNLLVGHLRSFRAGIDEPLDRSATAAHRPSHTSGQCLDERAVLSRYCQYQIFHIIPFFGCFCSQNYKKYPNRQTIRIKYYFFAVFKTFALPYFTIDEIVLLLPLMPTMKALAEPNFRNISRRTGMWFWSSVT